MAQRKGMDIGSGSGYRNVISKDPYVHSDSAMGRKQPQVVEVDSMLAKMSQAKNAQPKPFKAGYDAKQPEVTEIKATEDLETKPSAFKSFLGKAEALAKKGARYGYESGKKYLAEQAKKAKAKRIEELKEIDHPQVKELDSAKDKVASLERQIELNEQPDREERLFDELSDAKTQVETAEKKLKDINLSTLSDAQLKTLAVRHTGESDFFSMDSKNKYEREILRRINARKQIDADIAAEQNKPLKQSAGNSEFFADFFPKEDDKLFKTKK